jgi:hypothetical protein
MMDENVPGPKEFDEMVEFLKRERTALEEEFAETEVRVEVKRSEYHRIINRRDELMEDIIKHKLTISFLQNYWG